MIWRRGLRWAGHSIKTVVEVGKHNESVVVLISCDSDRIKCVQHWTDIINLIFDIIKYTCGDILDSSKDHSLNQSLIHPDNVTYLVDVKKITSVPLDYIAEKSLEKAKTLSYGKGQKQICSETFLVFDPYYGVDKDTLWKLFHEDATIGTVRTHFLDTIANLMHEKKFSFERVTTGEEINFELKQLEKDLEFSKCRRIMETLTDDGRDTNALLKMRNKLNECSILYWHLVRI